MGPLKELDRDWWRRQDQVELWEAVVASFGLDPRQWRGGNVEKIAFTSIARPDVGKFDARLREAESHLGFALKAVKIVESEDGRTYRSRVRRGDFSAWASPRFVEWAAVAEDDSVPDEVTDVEELHTKKRKSLLTVIAALATKEDLDHPHGRAPALVARARELGLNISDRNAGGILEEARDLVRRLKRPA